MDKRQLLAKGWHILQDVYDTGITLGLYQPDFQETRGMALSEWEEIPCLTHLQLLLSQTPYAGRALRYFNHAPWWYRNVFFVDADASPYATLRFEGVDYFCKVWLNDTYLGEHEGYSSPFSFEVGALLKRGEENLLMCRVDAPWRNEVTPGMEADWNHFRVSHMFKGTYDHADSFIQRDVNPVGIWNDVSVCYHGPVHMPRHPKITAHPDGDRAGIDLAYTLHNGAEDMDVTARYTIRETDTGRTALTWACVHRLAPGENVIRQTAVLEHPRLWEIWERGDACLYTLDIAVTGPDACAFSASTRFGVRDITLIRSQTQMQFSLNGRRVFLRAASYFPDVYVSRLSRERYYRDVQAAVRAGVNALRVHVHVCQPSFYEVCDELGMMVVQDSDYNWVHPTDDAFVQRAVGIYKDMVRDLYNHPSIVCWVVMNEPQRRAPHDFVNVSPGPQLVAALREIDGHRPYIKASCYHDDPESGDTHDYTGALGTEETHYTHYDVSRQLLNTEFGFDALPVREDFRNDPALQRRMGRIEEKIPAIQYYGYRLLKHIMQTFRLHRFAPCAGYVQFLFTDISPLSWYGVYDWYGVPKLGLKAFEESNMPVGLFFEAGEDGRDAALYIVNDLLTPICDHLLTWDVRDADGSTLVHGSASVDVAPDSVVRVRDLPVACEAGGHCSVRLVLQSSDGRVVARNEYDDPYCHPPHPKGHSYRLSHELGARLFDA